jgi:transglutaminase-like putative cysteine protease
VTVSAQRLDSAEYLRPTGFIDSEDPDVMAFARRVVGPRANVVPKAIALFYAVRDEFRYDPYRIDLTPAALRASAVLQRGFGFCIPKAILLAAAGRAQGIPTRLGFADVKNHISSERLRRAMKTDLFVFHGYTEFLLEGKWVKATPAFNASLCERFNVAPLEFDGRHDALLQQSDREGNAYMEYVRDRGQFADLPYDEMLATFEEHYPNLVRNGRYNLAGSFEDEAATPPPER